MAVSAIWIRDNMLSCQDQHDRQLTEAELKVQRSLQKLSIPDWYLNKRSNPPKILSNVTPIESRPSSWKNPAYKKNTDTMSSTTSHTGTYTLESRATTDIRDDTNTGTYKITRQPKTLEYSPRKSPSKKSSTKNEVFDTTIPKVKLSTNISKTFPKVSPSRKIQNINIFFPPGPPIDISSILENELESVDSRYTTFVVKKQFEKPKPTQHLEKPTESQCKTPTKTYVTRVHSEIFETSFDTPNEKDGFQVRAVSTPKCKPVNLFCSTIIEDAPKTKKYLSESYIEPIIIDDTMNSKVTDQSFLENSTRDDSEFNARKVRPNFIMEEKIRSIDPILFEKDESALLMSPKKGPASVRDIVRKLDSQNQVLGNKKFNTEVQQSPCIRFLYTKKKSTELENIVKSKQPTRGKGLVQGIIEEFNEKCKSTLTRQNRVALNQENFVKKLVNALEKGDNSEVEEVLLSRRKHTDDEDTESCSESEKSAVSSTSISLKDTDSSSDTDQRSPSLKSDDENRFEYEDLVTSPFSISENEARINEEDDSVYWIPVSKCKLPRTSSLLSMMSRLSMHHSPCVSPIRSDDSDHTIHASWGVTFKKTGSSSRKLFRIDETAITDSGYSDKSDRSGANSSSGTSTIDGTWSEDTQNESESESKSSRFKKLTPRRKTIVGYRTFIV